MSETTLKPCPLCGSEAELEDSYKVVCVMAGCLGAAGSTIHYWQSLPRASDLAAASETIARLEGEKEKAEANATVQWERAVAFATATGLSLSAGDPDGLEPRHVEAHCKGLVARAEKAEAEAAELRGRLKFSDRLVHQGAVIPQPPAPAEGDDQPQPSGDGGRDAPCPEGYPIGTDPSGCLECEPCAIEPEPPREECRHDRRLTEREGWLRWLGFDEPQRDEPQREEPQREEAACGICGHTGRHEPDCPTGQGIEDDAAPEETKARGETGGDALGRAWGAYDLNLPPRFVFGHILDHLDSERVARIGIDAQADDLWHDSVKAWSRITALEQAQSMAKERLETLESKFFVLAKVVRGKPLIELERAQTAPPAPDKAPVARDSEPQEARCPAGDTEPTEGESDV